MAAILAWFRLDLHRRWRSLLVLTLLIAFASGVVMTAVAGARRGSSAYDRLLAETLPATVMVRSFSGEFDWEPIRALPRVEVLTEIVESSFEIDGRPPPETIIFPPIGAEAMETIERPVVLEGRLADPTRAEEVVITPAFKDTSDKIVGDTVALGLYTPEQIDTAQTPFSLTAEQMEAALAAGLNPDDVAPAGGPVVEATIVGVIRSPYFSDETRDVPGSVIPSLGLFTEYGPHLLGANGLAAVGALVRLDGGEAAVPGFQEDLAELPVEVENLAALARDVGNLTGFEANSLLVFAMAAGVASLVLVGLSIARYAGSSMTDLQVMQAVGMTPRQSHRAATLGPALAALVGAVLGGGAAVLASQWFPVGLASIVEPAPGISVDVAVLVPALLAVPLLVAGGIYAAAAHAARSTGRAASPRRSTIATAAAASGLPVPVVVGARFALEPGQGGRAVPVRPALVGAVTGVLGVIAALTFSGGVDDAAANPARVGAVYEIEAWLGFNDFPFSQAPATEVLSALAKVPGVTGTNNTRHQLAAARGVQLMVQSYEPVGEPLDFIVSEGRLPVTATEILLGPLSAEELGVGIGDTVDLSGTSGETAPVVVGIGLVSPQVNDYATGALVTPRGYDDLFDGYRGHVGLVGLEPGVEPVEILPRLYEAVAPFPGDVGIQPLDWLHDLDEFRHVRLVPRFLAGFVALLALGAVGYALTTAVRRRRGDLAVLRAVGMTRRQSREVVVTQATVLALIGVVVGVPLGVALGRTVWRYVADALYIHYVPPMAGLALVLIVPLALLATNLLGIWPGQRAASMRVGHVLGAE